MNAEQKTKNTPGLVLLALQLSALALMAAESTPAPVPPPAPAAAPLHTSKGPPDVAAIRLDKSGKTMDAFLAAHESFLKRKTQGPIDLLFIGDSITAGWLSSGKDVWKKCYGAYHPANFSFGGDGTQHVLWRIENGELDGISPKVVVLMIGTNNGNNPALVSGVKKVVEAIRGKLPHAKILLLGMLPRWHDPQNPPWVGKSRAFTVQVNKDLAALDDGKHIRFLDFGGKFMDPKGVISKDIMPDGVHPGAAGYQLWAEAMQPLLEEMLK